VGYMLFVDVGDMLLGDVIGLFDYFFLNFKFEVILVFIFVSGGL